MEGISNLYLQIFLGISGTILLIIGLYVRNRIALWFMHLFVLFIALLLAFNTLQNSITSSIPTNLPLVNDTFASVFNIITILIAILSLFLSERHIYEYYNVLLWAVLGLTVITASLELVSMLIGFEILSISLYIMIVLGKKTEKSIEAQIKYFIFGIFATSFLIFGIAIIYGITGSFHITEIASKIKGINDINTLLILGIGSLFLVSGFAFKSGLFPFHGWIPDVYHGACALVVSFISSAPKIGILAILIKILYLAFPTASFIYKVLPILAILSMFSGSFLAIPQKNIKRILAYSSIVHIGYIFLVLSIGGKSASFPILFYIVIYAIMNIGAFSLITYIEESSNQEMTLENISGFGYQKPLLAGVFTIFLFSLAGIPPTAGFIGKIYIFGSLISQKQYLYASLGIINSIISLYYYLKIIIFLYRREEKHTISVSPSLPQGVNWIVLSLAIVIFGIIPNTLINIIELAIKSLSNF